MKNKRKPQCSSTSFKKSLVSYVLTLILFGYFFTRTGVPSWVFLFILVPMTISILHKYIDAQKEEEDKFVNEEPYDEEEGYYEDEWDEEPLELEDMRTLRKEWKDSDFV